MFVAIFTAIIFQNGMRLNNLGRRYLIKSQAFARDNERLEHTLMSKIEDNFSARSSSVYPPPFVSYVVMSVI